MAAAAQGVRTFKTNPKTGELMAARMADPTHELMLIAEDGIVLRTPVEHISSQGRSTQGVTLMDVDRENRGNKIAAVAVIDMEREYGIPEALPTGATVAGEEIAPDGLSAGANVAGGGIAPEPGRRLRASRPLRRATNLTMKRQRTTTRPRNWTLTTPARRTPPVRRASSNRWAVADRLRELGIEVPARRSFGKYVGAARSGDLVFVSGAGPMGPDGVITGKVGARR